MEDREKIILDPGAFALLKRMKALEPELAQLADKLYEVGEQQKLLEAQKMQVQGQLDELRVIFWGKVRDEQKLWMKEQCGKGRVITSDLIMDDPKPDTEGDLESRVIGVKVISIDPQEENLRQQRNIMKKLDDEEGNRGSA